MAIPTILVTPPEQRALLVLAHGAGAGMRHPFLEQFAQVLAARGVGTLRYEFAYMEAKKHRVDPPAVAAARVREAVAEAAKAAWARCTWRASRPSSARSPSR